MRVSKILGSPTSRQQYIKSRGRGDLRNQLVQAVSLKARVIQMKFEDLPK